MASQESNLESASDATIDSEIIAPPSSTKNHEIYQNDESITVVCRSGSDHPSDDSRIFDTHNDDNKTVTKLVLTNSVEKFIEGEEILDSVNPFRNTSKSRRTKLTSSDFITKEEILKQSKYVPVYIKNPDRVLTYPIVNEEVPQDRPIRKPLPTTRIVPTPAPRKVIEKPKRTSKSKTCQIYPNLSDIKVKTGTDIEESLYDRNEVILNAKKFDSLVNRMKFSSTEDLDEIDASNANTSQAKDEVQKEESKSYTNTVNSKEFREYLNKNGLVLFPLKSSSTVEKVEANPKKKTMMKRLSSMFTRSKMPYSSEIEKSYITDKKADHSKFFQATSNLDSEKIDDDWKSSISSVLSAADTEDYLSSPIGVTRRTKIIASSVPFQRNQLHQTMPHTYYKSVKLPITAVNTFKPSGKRENYHRNNVQLKQSAATNNSIDPFTFAKIHQIKRFTEENFRRDSPQLEPEYYKIPQQNSNFKKINTIEPTTYVGLRKYQNNLNSYESPRTSLVSPYKEVSRAEVMNKIYEYYRKSVNNTPVPTHVKDNFYSTLPIRPAKVYPVNNFARISNPIQNHQKIYDEVYISRPPFLSQDLTRQNSKQAFIEEVPATPVKDKLSNFVSPKKNNSSQRNSLYSSQVFKPIADLCSKIFTDPRTPKKRKSRGDAQSSYDDDYQNEKSNRNQQNDDSRRSSGRREDREKELRRHTTGMDMHHYGGSLQRSMDLEMSQSSKSRKGIIAKGYAPQHQGPLFDDDPGIMSEVETASTGFRRGGKQRSSLPVVRTPSKTLERPLGLVFLQYRSETKRALLPNEITSIDTVRALFVRSFPRQLSMIYLEGPNVKIYIHDSSKDMFYELEDVRSHLREIRDRSVLRLFESNEVAAAPQILSGNSGVPQQLPQQGGHWDQDPSYFSEPEFDSEYQHQHVHKSKGLTLPRGHVYNDRSKGTINMATKPMRSYGSRGSLGQFAYPSDQLYSIPDGYMSSPERGTRGYEEPYYTQYGGSRGASVTPVIDEEQSSAMDDQYSLYSVKVPSRISRNPNQMYDTARPEDLHRIRVEHMERQLANLTGLVQKALVQNPQPPSLNAHVPQAGPPFRNANGALDDLYIREKPPKLGKSYKSVSFEKSVSFSDEIEGVSKTHSPQQMADSKPPKPAIKSSTLPRTSSQERDRLKPVPPLKQTSSTNLYQADLTLAPEAYNHLRGLQKKARDLKNEVKMVRRLTQTQAVAVREDIKDTFMRIRATLLASSGNQWAQSDPERTRISREEEIYKQEVIRLEKDLADLEGSVEVLRGEVINRRTRVNMSAVEDMALVLSRASKIVAELKMRFPTLQQNLRGILTCEMEKVCREEAFLKDEPNRLEIALRRCKKLTGTLVTLKRLASVQEQRTSVEPSAEETQKTLNEFTNNSSNKPTPSPRTGNAEANNAMNFPENALDALLDELQTFAKPSEGIEMSADENITSDEMQVLQHVTINYPQNQSSEPHSVHGLRRLHSYPSGSDTDQDLISPPRNSGKPPVPERNSDVLQRYGHKKLPPPPPPRSSSSRSPTTNVPNDQMATSANSYHVNDQDSGSESNNSQENSSQRQFQLEMRHQELLKKQKHLQEQYQRLQQMSKSTIPLASNEDDKKGCEISSMKNLGGQDTDQRNENVSVVTTNKVYETEIL